MEHKLQVANRVLPAHQIPFKRGAFCHATCRLRYIHSLTCSFSPILMAFPASGVHSPRAKNMQNSPVTNVPKLPIDVLAARLKQRPPGRTPEHLLHLDIGEFSSIPSSMIRDIPQLPPGEKFHFRKWIHRTNNSDLALVTLQNDPKPKILKIVTSFIVCG